MQSLADIESKIASAEEKGKEDTYITIVLNMTEMGMDLDAIVKTTGVKQIMIEKLT